MAWKKVIQCTARISPKRPNRLMVFAPLGRFFRGQVETRAQSQACASTTSLPASPATAHTMQVPGKTRRSAQQSACPAVNITVWDDHYGYATYVSGDTDGDGLLDVGETWLFKVSGDLVAAEEVVCKQTVVEAERDINMYGLWFYQAID